MTSIYVTVSPIYPSVFETYYSINEKSNFLFYNVNQYLLLQWSIMSDCSVKRSSIGEDVMVSLFGNSALDAGLYNKFKENENFPGNHCPSHKHFSKN